jgi:hypothetical protein
MYSAFKRSCVILFAIEVVVQKKLSKLWISNDAKIEKANRKPVTTIIIRPIMGKMQLKVGLGPWG